MAQFRIVVPLRYDPPVRSHARVPMAREKNTGPAAISAPKGSYDMLCGLSRPDVPKTPSNFRFLWGGNRQDSCRQQLRLRQCDGLAVTKKIKELHKSELLR